MKKIPTLFKREFDDKTHKILHVLPEVTEGMEWVLNGEGVATVKWDGSCCAIIDGKFYKRYDAKKGKKAPEGAIPCCDPDPITGHHPHWVLVDPNDPADKWFVAAKATLPLQKAMRRVFFKQVDICRIDYDNQTYEAIGKHFNGNPYGLAYDTLIPHGTATIEVERTFEGIRDWLKDHDEEGIVFWKDGEPKCKIKRSDFGFEWPIKEAEND